MRKAQKQEVLDFIGSLHQAHKEIKEALEQKKNDVASEAAYEDRKQYKDGYSGSKGDCVFSL